MGSRLGEVVGDFGRVYYWFVEKGVFLGVQSGCVGAVQGVVSAVVDVRFRRLQKVYWVKILSERSFAAVLNPSNDC